MRGITFIRHNKFQYAGRLMGGIFSDNNPLNNPPVKKGYGIKLDIAFGRLIFPFKYLWKKETWTGVPAIKDIPISRWNEYFGPNLANRLRDKLPDGHTLAEVHDFKYGTYNPWKGKYLFRVNVPFVGLFIAVATPWRSFYFGAKTYDLDSKAPNNHYELDQGDYTWAYDLPCGRYMTLSSSIRKERD